MRAIFLAACVAISVVGTLRAQDRAAKVRNDRKTFEDSEDWVYNDLDEGFREAAVAGKPLMVVFRCIPCEACQEFDDQVARRDEKVRDLMDKFVCVRIVQANAIDLELFQYDFDQSFSIVLMHPDKTIYGRFGTRSGRPEPHDISLEGLAKAMSAALDMHRNHDDVRPQLAGKTPGPVPFKTPLDYPSLAGKYSAKLDYEGKVVASCVHCHQVREAERLTYRSAGKPIPDESLFPYPNPSVLGLTLDPHETATVSQVAAGSTAERDGVRVGDRLVSLAGQPLLSIADVQWVLHGAPASGSLPAEVWRGDAKVELTLTLEKGWRRRDDISWRATTWDLRRMGLGGMQLADLPANERQPLALEPKAMALKLGHVGEYGEHAVALKAGLRKGDVLVEFDGRDDLPTESLLLAYALQDKLPGDTVKTVVLRKGKRLTFEFKLQ